MKLSEFKQEYKDRIELIKANIRFSFQQEAAYAANNWASVFSTTGYTVSILIFIKILYAHINQVAGYSYNEMLLYFLIGQITFYANWSLILKNIYDFIPDVNKGNLDLILTKPVPSLFYIMTRHISIFSALTDGVPPTLAIILSINWGVLNLNITGIVTAVIINICGMIILQVIQLLVALPVFWLGESENIVDLAVHISGSAGTMIPLEGYGSKMQIIFGTLIPILISTGFATSAALGKTDPRLLLIWAIVVAAAALIIRNMAWKIAIRNYTSASS